MKKFNILQINILQKYNKKIFLSVFLSSFLLSSALGANKPLVFQWEVSHYKNTDQISLIFKKKKVELVTNTSVWKGSNATARLGHFSSPYTPKLKSLKTKVEIVDTRLQNSVSVLSLINDPRLKPTITPHAPIFKVRDKTLTHDAPLARDLKTILPEVKKQKWTCISCATYQLKGHKILRTLFKQQKNTKKKSVSTQVFTQKQLECSPKGQKLIECVDPLMGLFFLDTKKHRVANKETKRRITKKLK